MDNIEIVNLDADDLSFVKTIAERRQENKSKSGVKSHKWATNKSELGCNYEGVITEWAVLTALGLPMKRMEQLFPRGDGGFDFYWGNKKCDVKKLSRTNLGEVLIINPPGPTADIIIGCRIATQTRMEIIGVVSAKKFMDTKQEHDFGYGNRYYIPSDRLSPLSALRSFKAREKPAPT